MGTTTVIYVHISWRLHYSGGLWEPYLQDGYFHKDTAAWSDLSVVAQSARHVVDGTTRNENRTSAGIQPFCLGAKTLACVLAEFLRLEVRHARYRHESLHVRSVLKSAAQPIDR